MPTSFQTVENPAMPDEWSKLIDSNLSQPIETPNQMHMVINVIIANTPQGYNIDKYFYILCQDR